MSIAFKIAELISAPSPPPKGGWLNDMPEAFGALNDRGEVVVIGYLGEWYVPVHPTLRVRLHNWLISLGERHLPRGVGPR